MLVYYILTTLWPAPRQGHRLDYHQEVNMEVRTDLKAGTVWDDVVAMADDFTASVKNWWDDLPDWLTWPW